MKRAEIEQLLPSVFRRTALPSSPLVAVLEAMEALHEPSEEVLEGLDAYFDPWRAPDAFVPYLSRWVGLGWLASHRGGRDSLAPSAALRGLVADAARLARMRGTREGLEEFLRLATGGEEFRVAAARDDSGRERPFAMEVIAPPALEPQRELLEAILRHEKPVYVQCELRFGPDGPAVPVAARSPPVERP